MAFCIGKEVDTLNTDRVDRVVVVAHAAPLEEVIQMLAIITEQVHNAYLHFSRSKPDATGKLVFTFDKVSLTRGQVFRIYFYEKGGARNYVITLGPVDINRAKRLN